MSNDPERSIFGRQTSAAEPASSSEYTLPPEKTSIPPQQIAPRDWDDDNSAETQPPESGSVRAKEVFPAHSPTRSTTARSGWVRFLNFLMTLIVLGVVGFFVSVWYSKTSFEAEGPLQEATTFVVPKGASFNSIVPGLVAKNIIPSQGVLRVFIRGVSAAGKSSKLKAGEFAFSPGMSMRQVMDQLTDGKAVEYKLTFPEGWTSVRIMERIAADETLVGPIPPVPAEGTLLPSTFSFPRSTTRDQVVQRLRDAQSKALREIWAGREQGLPIKSPEELVVLASIVEKETGIAGERAHVASVFINRLRKGMRLQTDPTVIYGIWGGQGKPKDRGGLRQSELKKSTPYNTYIIRGLPPGPIANPGIESMRAVAHPMSTNDLYFVADGTGGHVFSRTLAEHNANVKKWRKIEADRKKANTSEGAGN